MKFHMVNKGWYLLCLLCLPIWGLGQQFPEPKGFVNDFKLLMTPDQRQSLDQYLTDFAETTSNEVAVVTLNLPPSESKVSYTTEMAHAWGIGGKENENGVLIAVYPNRREIFIAVGYGLEGPLPDFLVQSIIDRYVLPYFRQGDYYGGIRAAAEQITGRITGEYTDAPRRDGYYDDYPGRGQSHSGTPDEMIILIFIILIILLVLINRGGGGPGGRGRGYYRGGTYWWGSGSSGWSGSSGGGSSWGGGFGGFSGGGFGGGGAGGSW